LRLRRDFGILHALWLGGETMDEVHVIEEAFEMLRQIMMEYPIDEVGLLAGSMTLAV
jgi:hypothetical protein